MIAKLRKFIALHLLNYRGWKTDKKIIVFESDDWGSIRMPSRESYNFLLDSGIPVHKSSYNKFDSLECESDLQMLSALLRQFTDKNGNHPIFTMNTVMANPDFKKIRESGFREYHHELFTTTYKKYPEHSECFKIFKEGIKDGLFQPQFHGREHLNVNLWLQLLQNNNEKFRLAFDQNFWGLSRDVFPEMKRSVQAAFDMKSRDELDFQKKSIKEGLKIFEQIFGFRPQSFIANNFIWDPELNRTLYNEGINYLQGMKYQKLPLLEPQKRRHMIRHYLGEKNKWNQYYLVRNCEFEPTLHKDSNRSLHECINGIKTAFFWNKPAVISTHRLNYIGFIDPYNRERNLVLLEKLLSEVVSKWPDVEFWSSDQLGNYLKKDVKKI